MKHIVFFIFLLPIFLIANNNWPSLQGNLYFTGNNDEITPKSNKLQWTFQADAGLVFPIPTEDKIFISSFNHNLYCLDMATGKKLWQFDSKLPIIKTPVVENNSLFLVSGQKLSCLNTTNGNILWQRNEAPHYITMSPVLYKNKIFYSTRKKIICRNMTNGQILWTNASPIYGGTATVFDNIIYVHSRHYLKQLFLIMAIDAKTGHFLWQQEIIKGNLIFTPVVYNKKVYVGTKNLLYCFDAYSGKILWTRNFPSLLISESAFNDKFLFLTTESGILYEINPETGNTKHYYSFAKGRNYFSLVGESVFLLERKTDTLYTIDLVNNTISPFYHFKLKNYGHYFTIAKGNIFIPLNKTLYVLGAPLKTLFLTENSRTIYGKITPNANPSLLLCSPNFQKKISVNSSGNFSFQLPPNSQSTKLYVSSENYEYLSIPITNQKRLNIHLSPLKQTQSLSFQNIYFDFNRADLKKESILLLHNIKNYLNANPDLQILIKGYTDNIGKKKFNLLLSEKRANKVKEFLVKNGINENRIQTQGFGEKHPIADNNTEKGRALNRRIEFVLSSK